MLWSLRESMMAAMAAFFANRSSHLCTRRDQQAQNSKDGVSREGIQRCSCPQMWWKKKCPKQQAIHNQCHLMHPQVLLTVHHKHSVHQILHLVHQKILLIKIHFFAIKAHSFLHFLFWSLRKLLKMNECSESNPRVTTWVAISQGQVRSNEGGCGV